MRNSLVEALKPSEEIDWDNSPLKSGLLATWTVVKWVTLGLLAIMAGIVWLIVSIVFAEVNERR